MSKCRLCYASECRVPNGVGTWVGAFAHIAQAIRCGFVIENGHGGWTRTLPHGACWDAFDVMAKRPPFPPAEETLAARWGTV